MNVLDLSNAQITDVGQFYQGEDIDNMETVVVTAGHEDDDQIMFWWGHGKDCKTLIVPADRIRQLLSHIAEQHKKSA